MTATKYTVKVERNTESGYKTWTVTLSRATKAGTREESDFNENNLRTALRQMAEAIDEDQKF